MKNRIVKGFHFKRGEVVHIVIIDEEFEDINFLELRASAKKYGGQWCAKKGDSPAGFAFSVKFHADLFVMDNF